MTIKKETYHSCIIYKDDTIRYFDKEGNELHVGDIVIYPTGKEEKLYLTEDGELGTDATKPKWIEDGRAYECQFGIYPLTFADVQQIVLKRKEE